MPVFEVSFKPHVVWSAVVVVSLGHTGASAESYLETRFEHCFRRTTWSGTSAKIQNWDRYLACFLVCFSNNIGPRMFQTMSMFILCARAAQLSCSSRFAQGCKDSRFHSFLPKHRSRHPTVAPARLLSSRGNSLALLSRCRQPHSSLFSQ